jgi:type II secretory pathway pseudopilin PulG
MKRRPAYTLLELTVAAAMLGVLLAASLQMLSALTSYHRSAERRAIALEAVQFVADQASNLPWSELTTESASQVKIPAALSERLPNAALKISVTTEAEPTESKRIMVELTWADAKGRTGAPARLTTWAYPNSPKPKR